MGNYHVRCGVGENLEEYYWKEAMEKISKLEKNLDCYLNDDNLYGTFFLEEDLNEMARFGAVPKTKYEIHLEGGEGNIPHMHICVKSGKNVVLRVCILKNEYFREKDDKNNVLNSKEKKALNDYLNSMYNEEFNITRWQAICMQWNEYNPGHAISNIKNLKKPDFSTITEPSK